jgi:Tfp pilus assembly protein PilE
MADNDKIWIGQGGEKYGPYSEANILQWLSEGKVNAATLVWRSGMPNWVSISTMFPTIATESPPPPPPQSQTPHLGYAVDARTPSGPNYSQYGQQSGKPIYDRASLPAPPSLHWFLVLLFAILTFGIFAIVWPFIQANWVKKIDRGSNATLLLAIGLVFVVIGEVLYFSNISSITHGQPNAGFAVGGLLIFASWVINLVAYFSMSGSVRRNMAAYGVQPEIGGITLFFFTMFYLQGQMSWLARWRETGQASPKASKGVFWWLLIIPFVIAIFAAIAIPAYQDYTIRSQVSEAAVLTDGAKTSVAEFYANQGQLPSNNQAAGLANPDAISGKYVSAVTVSNGKIIAEFETPNADSHIRGTYFMLNPTPSAGSIVWDCTSSTVPQKYLPTYCRN